ncbi:MAG: glycoside hydrolase family 3 protein [Eubacterium sp.]
MELLTKASYSDEVTEREKTNLDIAYRAALESIVMLKNDGALPFRDNSIAAYGSGVSVTIKGGTGSGEVNERHSVSIFEGLQNKGFDITNRRLNADYRDMYAQAQMDFVKSQRKKVYTHLPQLMSILFNPFQAPEFYDITDSEIKSNNTDNCIYVLSRQAGEGGDRKAEKGDLFITDYERKTITKLAKSYKNFVLIINAGSQLDMAFVDEIDGINAILFICQLGTQGGNAVADILIGNVSPSGKLADTWAKQYSDLPFSDEYSYLNGNTKDEFYKEGIYVGYRYFDSFSVEPKYPFGFGLSYTEFEINNAKASNNKSKITITADVKNIGVLSGKEVIQIYVSAPNGNIDKEYQKLVAFEKTDEIKPDNSQKVIIEFDAKQMASFDEKRASYVLEKGEYIIRIGNFSRNTKSFSVINIDDEIIVSKHDNILPKTKEFEELKSPIKECQDTDNLDKINLKQADFETAVYEYKTPDECKDERVQKILNTLTTRDMTDICVGIGMFGGKTKFNLPGSVGNTTSKFWDKGLANVTLCDGPAGIRIQKRSAVTKSGKVKAVDSSLGTFDLLMPEAVQKIMKGNPEKDTIIYQYTTAFPVSAALAQTWNTDLLYEIGKAVYSEMKEYGCTYWLAPAVNIHRNPLCGRNFEYYSEDPFLAGEMVTAMALGVQQEKGFYVTVKHFACNNQEENRNNMTANLSERALREIYLPAFESAVRKGKAKSIMTAYNMINGVYCSNSYDLCTKVLRNEWNFDGVVMTDWFASMLGNADDALCMSAGNDLIMPGGSFFKFKILMGIKSGKITKNDLRRCCSNIIKSILDSDIQREYIDK